MRSRTMLPFLGALALAVGCDDSTNPGDAFAPDVVPAGTVVLERSIYEGDPGDTTRVRAFVLDARGRRFALDDLTWSSQDSSVAVVHDGRLYLVQAGETQLTVEYNGTKLTAAARASNKAQISKVDIFPDPLSLTMGEEQQLGLYIRYSDGKSIENTLGVSWASTDPSVASVTGTGVITAHKAGKTKVIAKRSKYADTVDVTIVESAAEQPEPTLSIAPDTAQVAVGATFTFSTALSTGEKSPSGVSWTIDDPAVASIAPSGELLGKKEGVTAVHAVHGGQAVKAVLRVVAAPVEEEAPAPTPSNPDPSVSGGIAKAAELPRVFLDTRYPNLSGRQIRVPAGGNLQKAIDDAQPGDEILLAPGAVFSGQFYLRPKSGNAPIVIRTDVTLPPEGTRMTPAIARQLRLAKIVSSAYGPVIRTAGLASNYRLTGLEITVDESRTETFSIVRFGAVESREQSSMAQIPTNLILDRSYVHGHPSLNVRRCVELQSKSSAVIDSWLSECHAKGFDAQAIAGWNGPGPYKIVNNYLEGSGENIMFGGAEPSVPNVIPSDIEIRRNHFFKPAEWYTSKRWTIKNSFEIKFAKRVLLEANVFENNWTDGQVGTALLIKSTGGFGWAETSDVTFRYNVIKNVGGVFSIAGRPEEQNAIPATRISISHNVVYGVGSTSIFGSGSGTGRFVTMSNELTDVIIENNTVIGSTRSLLLTTGSKPPSDRIQFRNNIVEGEITSDSGFGPWAVALNGHITSWQVEGNVFISTRAGDRPANNTYLSRAGDIGLINPPSFDYRLSSSSTVRSVGTGNSTPGADVDAIISATRGVAIQ